MAQNALPVRQEWRGHTKLNWILRMVLVRANAPPRGIASCAGDARSLVHALARDIVRITYSITYLAHGQSYMRTFDYSQPAVVWYNRRWR
jgi:hypothetical protein